MERTISVEEKIRRAEEIYARRKQGNERPIATVPLNDKKDVKLLKKMIIQILICVLIYLVIYTIQNSNYIFSQDFLKKVNEILSYDTNFIEIYENIKKQIMPEDKGIGGAEQKNENQTESQNIEGQNQTTNEMQGVQPQTENQISEAEIANQNLSQEEKDINAIKSTTSFIKPVQGTISSKFGQRETATGRVPKNHTGTDIAANLGTKIVSASEGEVVIASEEGDYGKHLKIQIGEVSVIYAHCNNLYVKLGDKISQGQEIGEVGSTRKFNTDPIYILK